MSAARGNRYKTAKTKVHALANGTEKSFFHREFKKSNLTMLDRIITTNSPPTLKACLQINKSLPLVRSYDLWLSQWLGDRDDLSCFCWRPVLTPTFREIRLFFYSAGRMMLIKHCFVCVFRLCLFSHYLMQHLA
jgi:hypothetical protein